MAKGITRRNFDLSIRLFTMFFNRNEYTVWTIMQWKVLNNKLYIYIVNKMISMILVKKKPVSND